MFEPTGCLVRIYRGIFFFFNDTATTEIYTLSLHDALPILAQGIVNSGNTWPLGAVEGNFAAYTAEPVFRAYDVNGTAVPLPVDLNTVNPATGRSWVFDIRTIRVSLNVIGATTDNQTRVRPV